MSVDFFCGYRGADGSLQAADDCRKEGEGKAKRVSVSLFEEVIFLC